MDCAPVSSSNSRRTNSLSSRSSSIDAPEQPDPPPLGLGPGQRSRRDPQRQYRCPPLGQPEPHNQDVMDPLGGVNADFYESTLGAGKLPAGIPALK